MPDLPDLPPILDELEIDDLETLRKLANPMRLKLLSKFREPRSIAEVAHQIGVPPTRLYYHVNMLVDAGVITVVDTRKRGAQLEKVYRTVAHSIQPAAGILAKGDVDPEAFAEVAASLVLDSARTELTASLTEHIRSGLGLSQITGALGRALVSLTPEQAEEWSSRIQEFAIELKGDDHQGTDATAYGFTYSFFPIDSPAAEDSP